jgi:hypothetical protein
MATSSASQSRFDFAAEVDASLDWGSIQFWLDCAADAFGEGLGSLHTGADLHELRYDAAYGELIDAAKATRELARQLAARAYAHAEELKRQEGSQP